MLSAIRITLGVIMAIIAAGLTFALITLAIGYRSQSPLEIESALTFAVILSLPIASAWLLLFPKAKKHALIGLALAVFFFTCYLLFRAVATRIIFGS